jgi:hypothetical protein
MTLPARLERGSSFGRAALVGSAVILFWGVSGCGSPPPKAPEPKEAPGRMLIQTAKDAAALLPAAGDTRIYRTTIKTSVAGVAAVEEVKLEFRFSSATGGARKVRIFRDGKEADEQTWSLSGGALVILSQKSRRFNPPLLLAAPLKDGESKRTQGRGPRSDGTQGPYSHFIVTTSVEEVDLAQGTLAAQPFESQTTWTGPKGQAISQTRSWWALQKGLVRQVESIKWEGVEREIVSVLDLGAAKGTSE